MLPYILLMLIVIIGAIGLIYAQYELCKFDEHMRELEQNMKQKRQ